MKHRHAIGSGILGFVLATTLLARSVPAQASDWPLEIDGNGAHLVLYQPQPDSLRDDKLSGRAAVSVQRSGDSEPTFGAVWLEARVSTDRDARTVTVLDVAVRKVKFPGATPELEAVLAKTIQDELPKHRHTFSLDRLLTTLDQAVNPGDVGAGLQHAAPHIVLAKEPTVLVTIDGQPKLQAVEGSSVMRVVNTPFVILFDLANKSYFLQAGDRWAKAERIEGPWTNESSPPREVTTAVPPRSVESDPGAPVPVDAGDARVLVATEPTELIVCAGEPQWTPLAGNELLYLSNSENDVFLELESQQVFVLLAGRWYASASLERGPWSFVPADRLPAAFARIPPDSVKGPVRSFVAGTDEARDALLDAAIPQTCSVKRSEAHCSVSYDGDPRFESIQGTQLQYAVNTSSSVIECEGKFYCCSQAVWFSADSPLGPWTICTQVPAGIASIPPSCPVYPVRYVYVYDSTPEIVYVGYLPGYVGCYASGPTIVYGTGYWYPGWYGSVYYPRPCTWGFRPHYNPWTCGWTLGFGFGWGVHPGWFGLSVGWGNPGWWGHGGFCGSHFDMHAKSVRMHPMAVPPLTATLIQSHAGHSNVYNRPENLGRNHVPAGQTPKANPGHPTSQLPNDVYVDSEGRVVRRTGTGWEQLGPGGWKATVRPKDGEQPLPGNGGPAKQPPNEPRPGAPSGNPPRNPPAPTPAPGNPEPGAGKRPVPPPTPARPAALPVHDELERMHQAREQGNARASAAQKARGQPAPPPAKPRG